MKLNKVKMVPIYQISLLWVYVIVVACSPQTQLKQFGNLEARVQGYYTLEKSGDWQKTYYLRTPAFRRVVNLDDYVSGMKKDSSGWRLDKFSVVQAKEINGKVHVSIKFEETAPISTVHHELRKKLPDQNATTILTERTEDSVWMLIGDEWFCYDPVSRSHLSLNVPLVSE